MSRSPFIPLGSTPPAARRRAALLGPLLLALAACGGGGGADEEAPTVVRFAADREAYFVGERATLDIAWRGRSATLQPGGVVAPTAQVTTPPLDIDSTFTLTVRGEGAAELSRSLTLPVRWRDRHAPLADALAVSGHAGVTLADGSVLLIGGSRPGQHALSEHVDRYDPATGRIQRLGSLVEGRSQPQALLLNDGRVLVAGGATSGLTGRPVEMIDPRTGSIQVVGELSAPRIDAAGVVLADGRALVCGGFTAGEGGTYGISRSCDLWDPATATMRRLDTTMVSARAGHRMTRLRDGRVLVSGGYSADTPYRYAELLDPQTLRFTAINAPVTQPLAQQVAVLHTDGSVLLIGGERAPGLEAEPRAEVWRFDPGLNAFMARPPLARARTLAAGVALRDGRVLLFGGQTESSRHAASAERYDPASGGTPIAALDQDRAYLSANRLPDGRVLVVGGETIDGLVASRAMVYE